LILGKGNRRHLTDEEKRMLAGEQGVS